MERIYSVTWLENLKQYVVKMSKLPKVAELDHVYRQPLHSYVFLKAKSYAEAASEGINLIEGKL